jgi:hypothetical protein
MSSLVKNALLEGKPLPDGIKAYFKQSISIRGAKDVIE